MKHKYHITGILLVGLVLACQTNPSAADGGGTSGAEGGALPSDGGTHSGGGSGGRTNGAGSSAAAGGSIGGMAGSGSGGAPVDENCGSPRGTCELIECAPAQLSGDHVATCSELRPATNPPTSGPHYPVWAKFGIYDQPILDGFFIHSLEHSSVALLYDCDAAEQAGLDCGDLKQALVDFYEDFPVDPLCSDVPNRLIVAPRPGLGVPFAAAAWGHYLRGNCFDADLVSEFVAAHYGMNYENLCNTGVDPLDPGCPK